VRMIAPYASGFQGAWTPELHVGGEAVLIYRNELASGPLLEACRICDGSGLIPRKTRHHGMIFLNCPCYGLPSLMRRYRADPTLGGTFPPDAIAIDIATGQIRGGIR